MRVGFRQRGPFPWRALACALGGGAFPFLVHAALAPGDDRNSRPEHFHCGLCTAINRQRREASGAANRAGKQVRVHYQRADRPDAWANYTHAVAQPRRRGNRLTMSAIGPKQTHRLVHCICLLLTQSGHHQRGIAAAGFAIILASPRAWAACRPATTPRGAAIPPKPRCLAEGKSGRRSCRWQP